MLTSAEVALPADLLFPATFQEADNLSFLKKSTFKGPKSFVLALITSITYDNDIISGKRIQKHKYKYLNQQMFD